MNITRESDGSLRVELSQEELHSFQLSYPRLDYKDAKTRRLLKTLLEGAGAITGFDRHPQKLMIEAFPSPGGGCTLYFTSLGQKRKRYRRVLPCILQLASADALLAALEQINQKPVPKTELFRLNEQYILIVHADVPPLSEYGDPIPATQLRLAYIREHGHPLQLPL